MRQGIPRPGVIAMPCLGRVQISGYFSRMEHRWAQIAEARAELERRIDGAEMWDDSCEAAAYEYARLMVEAGVKSRHAARRLQHAGLTYEGAWELLGKAAQAKALAEKQAEDAALADATPLCPHCLSPVGQFDHFCPKCAGPVTAIASMDPMGRIYSAGRAFRLAATDKKSKGIVVLGMWLIFGPSFLVLLFALWSFVSQCSQGWYDYYWQFEPSGLVVPVIGFMLMLGAFALYFAILCKVTAHWLQQVGAAGPKGDGPVLSVGDDDEGAGETSSQ